MANFEIKVVKYTAQNEDGTYKGHLNITGFGREIYINALSINHDNSIIKIRESSFLELANWTSYHGAPNIQLKDCPACATSNPEMFYNDDFLGTWSINCSADNCPISIRTKNKLQAIDIWNNKFKR